MSMFELETPQLASVDWNRHSVGFGPALKDRDQQLAIGTVPLTQMEMRVLYLILNRVVPGTDDVPAKVFPGLKQVSDLLTAWMEWSKQRDMP